MQKFSLNSGRNRNKQESVINCVINILRNRNKYKNSSIFKHIFIDSTLFLVYNISANIQRRNLCGYNVIFCK